MQSLCLIASWNNKICGSLRFWEVMVCGNRQLLMGPLAVQPDMHGKGFGRALVVDGLRRAQQHKQWDFVLVSGDPNYYPKFGFAHTQDGQFIWPGDLLPNVLQIRALHKAGLDRLPRGPWLFCLFLLAKRGCDKWLFFIIILCPHPAALFDYWCSEYGFDITLRTQVPGFVMRFSSP